VPVGDVRTTTRPFARSIMLVRPLFVVAALAVSLPAQTTWIVNAGGGAGVHFLDLPSAVAAASNGDTIIVQTGPFGEGADPFVTSKGLTIVGEGGQVPIGTSTTAPIEVNGLLAGLTFRLVGFSRPTVGELNLRVINCAGNVHLESLQVREPGFMFPTGPAVVVENSPAVTMRAVDTFGSPAVQVTNSQVVLVSCRLGVTHIGLGGGPCLHATNSTVYVAQPSFDPAWHPYAIQSTSSQLTIAGDGASLVGGNTAVVTSGGSVTIDPAVPRPGLGGPVSGSATVTFRTVPASRTTAAALLGATLGIVTTAPVGSAVFQALGLPGAPVSTPFGLLGIDVTGPFAFFPLSVTGPTGVVTNSVTIPAAVRGSAWTTQAVVWDGVAWRLSLPVTFVPQ
jgi:hypothetical protein